MTTILTSAQKANWTVGSWQSAAIAVTLPSARPAPALRAFTRRPGARRGAEAVELDLAVGVGHEHGARRHGVVDRRRQRQRCRPGPSSSTASPAASAEPPQPRRGAARARAAPASLGSSSMRVPRGSPAGTACRPRAATGPRRPARPRRRPPAAASAATRARLARPLRARAAAAWPSEMPVVAGHQARDLAEDVLGRAVAPAPRRARARPPGRSPVGASCRGAATARAPCAAAGARSSPPRPPSRRRRRPGTPRARAARSRSGTARSRSPARRARAPARPARGRARSAATRRSRSTAPSPGPRPPPRGSRARSGPAPRPSVAPHCFSNGARAAASPTGT